MGVSLLDDDLDGVYEDEEEGEKTNRAQKRHSAMNKHANNPTEMRTTKIVHQACMVQKYASRF